MMQLVRRKRQLMCTGIAYDFLRIIIKVKEPLILRGGREVICVACEYS